MNYFEFYGIPVSFSVDEEQVKKKYLEFSREFHPDFFINQPSPKQEEVLEASILNTRAFETLSDFDKRMKYILEMKNMIHERQRYELPPDFLMEMMGLNETLMDLKMKPDQKKISDFGLLIADFLKELHEEVRSVVENYDDATAGEEQLKKITGYYYKKKYLLRLKESLDTFGQ